jgi:hypothetical protein
MKSSVFCIKARALAGTRSTSGLKGFIITAKSPLLDVSLTFHLNIARIKVAQDIDLLLDILDISLHCQRPVARKFEILSSDVAFEQRMHVKVLTLQNSHTEVFLTFF